MIIKNIISIRILFRTRGNFHNILMRLVEHHQMLMHLELRDKKFKDHHFNRIGLIEVKNKENEYIFIKTQLFL